MKHKKMIAVLGGILVTALLAGCSGGAVTGKQNAAGDLVIPLEEITKNVKFFAVTVDGTDMEIIAARTSSGEIRTAFNTCQVCYDSGYGYYKASGNTVTCQNCGYQYTVDEFDTSKSGGCRPWAITEDERTVTDDTLTISIDILRSSKDIFASWKA